mmetsp:Transcript_10492/g.23997  ORF Transcript_10492/g.23997 Transcript_10492/m.23997 type:complete len:83 (-) Transcript_10492:134-382(-)
MLENGQEILRHALKQRLLFRVVQNVTGRICAHKTPQDVYHLRMLRIICQGMVKKVLGIEEKCQSAILHVNGGKNAMSKRRLR